MPYYSIKFFKKIVSPYIGEWIEIVNDGLEMIGAIVSPYIGEWIEIIYGMTVTDIIRSHLT